MTNTVNDILLSSKNSSKTTRTRRKIICVNLLAIIAVYVVFCADFYIRQESYLLDPNTDPTGMRRSRFMGKGRDSVLPKLPNDDAEIHYRKYITTTMPSKGRVLYLHGNKGSMNQCEWEIDFLIDLGYDVWTMDYRGFGDSRGRISESALKEDSLRVFDEIIRIAPEHKTIIWGRSFGSGVAASVAAAATKKPALLVLETPYWSLVDAVLQKYPFIPSSLFRYEFPTHEFLSSIGCPIHLIHGTQDEKIHPNSSDRLLDLCESKAIKVKGHSIMCGKHNLRDKKTIVEFDEIATSILN